MKRRKARGRRGMSARNPRGTRVLALVVLGLAFAAAALQAPRLLEAGWKDPRVNLGSYDALAREGDEARDLDRQAEADAYSMDISCAAAMELEEGQTSVEARLENPSTNHCDQRIRIFERERPDDLLFESGALSPGEQLQTVDLSHPLEAGTHHAVVEFQGYERGVSLLSNEGRLLGHNSFGASCAAEVDIICRPQE